MTSLSKHAINTFFCAAIFSSLCVATVQAADAVKPAPNPNFVYMSEGKAVSGWGLQLGDPENWATSIDTSRKGKSTTGKLSIEPIDFQATGDALKLSWSPRKAVKGVFALYGATIDLSKFENEGAIVFDMKMDTTVNYINAQLSLPNLEQPLSMRCSTKWIHCLQKIFLLNKNKSNY